MSSNVNKKALKIGIVGFPSSGHFGIGVAYMQYFSQLGDVEIISHTETTIRTHLDLLVVPGGPDVDTSRYLKEGESIHLMVGKPCPFRERFDHFLLPQYIENKTPIFGICRGHQSIAVHFGGNLHQHMFHESNGSDRTSLVHYVEVNNDLLSKYTGFVIIDPATKKQTSTMKVNSIHHQAVNVIPKEAVQIACYKPTKNGYSDRMMNEALIYPDHKIATVQWHPEEIEDSLSDVLIKEFLLK